MSKILITGGSGMVGTALTSHLISKGFEVVHLGRKSGNHQGVTTYKWDYKTHFIDPKALEGVDFIINLAGANVAGKRWTTSYKKEIYESRVKSTQLLVNALRTQNHQVKKLTQASAVGIYEQNNTPLWDETGALGNDFLSHVCKDWEASALEAPIPTAIVRIGIVLSATGGFIDEVSKPIHWFVGAPLGTGKQQMSWIHVEDLCGMFIRLIAQPELIGVYNAVSPNPISNRNMIHQIAFALHRKILLPPIPELVLRVLFGEMTAELVSSHALLPKRMLESGFSFQYPDLKDALHSIISHTKH